MSSATEYPPVQQSLAKDRSGFLSALRRHIESGKLGTSGSLLVLGASDGDAAVMREAGWSSITLSNFSGLPQTAEDNNGYLELDAENLSLPDESFESVVAYEVLHHCRSPHRALCEMLRVSRRYAIFQEPNDSLFYRCFRRLGLISQFEIPAVVANGFLTGGVRNTAVPNYIYRWNHSAVSQTAMSFVPDRRLNIHSYPCWELNHTEFELGLRLESRIGYAIRAAGGPRNFRLLLRATQAALNRLPLLRQQGNQFFCCIEKTQRLHDWLHGNGNGITFNRHYGSE